MVSCEDASYDSGGLVDSPTPAKATTPEEEVVEVIPDVAAVINSINISDGLYKAGDIISISVNLNKSITVTGTPRFVIDLGGNTVYADYASGSASSSLSFSYTVQAGDNDLDGIVISSVELNSGTLIDSDSLSADLSSSMPSTSLVLVDTTDPIISTLDLPADQTYNSGQALQFTLNLSESVTVSGVPSIALTLGAESVQAVYVSGSGSDTLVFSYALLAGEVDNDGVNYGAIALNGGGITDAAGNSFASVLTDTNMAAVLVDALAPTLDSLIVNAGVSIVTNNSITLNMTATDGSDMYITETAGCSTGGAYQSFVGAHPYILSANFQSTIYVKVKDAAGNESGCSNVSIAHDNLPPNAISSITMGNDGSDIASDKSVWTAATDNGPAGVATYEYATSTSADSLNMVTGGTWADTSSALTFQFELGLTLLGSTNYYTVVRAIDAAGNVGPEFASAAWQIIVSPEAVTNLELTLATTESLDIGWSYPQDNGTPITDYEVMIKGGTFSDWTVYADGISTATSSSVTSLDPETTYELKIRALNGINYSGWSNTLSADTLPNVTFFAPGFKAINVSGAPKSKLVSFNDANDIYLNGILVTTLAKHGIYEFESAEFDQIEATKAFYVAGKLGTGTGSSDQGNATWSTQAWVGKEFFFNFSRATPLKVKVFAFTDSTITITKGGVAEDSAVLTAGTGHTFSISTYAAYEMVSTGYIVAFAYGNQSGIYFDPVPILPASTDIIGIPSKTAKISSGTSSNNYTAEHSDGVTTTGALTAGSILTISERTVGLGTGLYKGAALRIRSDEPIMAISNADSDGYCQAPFVPVSMLKKNFGINQATEWVAFASDRAVTITVTKPDLSTETITLTQTGGGTKTPYKAYSSTSYPEGTLFSGSDVFQAWYQPTTSTYSGGEDETIMFGWD